MTLALRGEAGGGAAGGKGGGGRLYSCPRAALPSTTNWVS